MATVLIMGASKGIGLATTKLALEHGHSVVAFARSADRIALQQARLKKLVGDARQIDDVRLALAGVDAVIQTLGVPANARMLTGPVDLFSSATATLLPLMNELGIRRLISVTGFGAGESRSSIAPLHRLGFNLVFGRAYGDKDIQEHQITQSGLDWTIVRPGVLINTRKVGRYRVLVSKQEWRNGIISRGDVADFLVKQVSDDTCLKQAPVLVR